MANTWDESASQIVNMMNQYVGDGDMLNIAHVKKMRDMLFGDHLNRPSVWDSIAYEAISELLLLGEWEASTMVQLLIRKQRDYGHQNILQGGLFGVAIRLSDKIERYANLKKKNATAENEPVIDTLLDMVGYSVIARMLIEDTFKLELGV